MTERRVDGGVQAVAVVTVEPPPSGSDPDRAVASRLRQARDHLVAHGAGPTAVVPSGLAATFSSPRAALAWAISFQHQVGDPAAGVRIGLTAGEALPGDPDPLAAVVAAAVDVAAQARAGEVLVDDVIRLLVGGDGAGVTFVERATVGTGAASARLWAATDRPRDAPVAVTIGRHPETAALADLVAATRAGVGRALWVEGDAGIGKTHLLGTVRQLASTAGARVVPVTCDEIDRRPGLLPRAVAAGVARPDHPLHPLLDGVGELPADRSYAVVDACLDALEELAGATPLLVVVEDAHWADDLTLATLRATARQLGPSGVSVVATFRPAPRPRLLDRLVADTAPTAAASRPTLLRLGPLDPTDVDRLAATTLGTEPGPNLRALLDGAAGNPLYITELLGSLRDEGLVEVHDGVADVASADVPHSLRDTLARRLGWLPAATRDVLQLAALLGSSFRLTELAALRGTTEVAVVDALRDATAAGLLVGDADELRFHHDLVRHAVYESMTEAERRGLHRAAGRALAGIGAPTIAVARQFALGALPGDVEAIEWLTRAAAEVTSVSPSEACGLYEAAAALAPPGWPGLGALQAQMIEPLAWCGRFDRAEAIASTLLATQPDVEFAVVRGMASIEGNRGRIDAAIAHLTRATEVADAPPEEVERLRCFRGQLEVLTGVTPWPEAVARAEATLAHGRAVGDATTQCVALQVIAVAHAVAGHGEATWRAVEDAMRLLDSGHVAAMSYVIPDAFHAGTLLSLDRIDEALAAADAARTRHVRSGTLTQLPLLHMLSASAHFETGQWDDCLADIEAGEQVATDIDSHNFTLYFAALAARVALRRGDTATADAHLATGAARLATGSLFGADWLFDVQAEVSATGGDLDTAISVSELVWQQTAALRHFYGSRARAIALTRIAVAADRPDLAEEVAASAEEGAERSPVPTAVATARHCRGLADGDPAPLLDAVAALRPTAFRPALAAACEDAAAALLARGARADAAPLLDDAAGILTGLAADADLARVQALQTRAGVRVPTVRRARPTVGWSALTPTERTVSDLVAEGLTNPQIGERLCISRRTVETHLAHVFQKLGLSGRAQLAAEVVRRGRLEDP